MARPRNPLWQWVMAAACIAFVRLTAVLPLRVARALGRYLGRLAYYLIPRVRSVGMANLDLAYGDTLTRREKRRILKGAAENIGVVAAEFSAIPKLHGEFLRQNVVFRGWELIDFSQGGLVIGAHLGNWEWMATAFQELGHHRIAIVVRPLNNRWIEALVARTRGLTTTIAKERAGPEIVRLLREGWLVGLLVDQSPRDNAVPVRFFGAPCWGTIAPVMAAVRARVPIYGTSVTREAGGRYCVEFLSRIEMTRSGDLHQDLIDNTQRCQDFIEGLVREHPEQWLWLHRRWKPRPKLEAEWRKRLERKGGQTGSPGLHS